MMSDATRTTAAAVGLATSERLVESSAAAGIEFYVTTAITDEVVKGLRLYGMATGELTMDTATTRVQRWLSLFRDNPMGRGLFALAKYRGEQVGIISLIDFEMRVRGTSIKAGKAEFWALKPEALKLALPGTNTRLPWALFQYLREQAGSYGYDAVLTVSPKAARYLRRAGDHCISTPLASYVALGNKGTGRLGRYVDRLLQPRRFAAMVNTLIGMAGTRTNDVVEVERLHEAVTCDGDTALISSSVAMINTRFPAPKYLKFLLQRPGAAPWLFVFTRPVPGGTVQLVHWSGMPEVWRDFAAILSTILARMKSAHATNLLIEVPLTQFPFHQQLQDLGFLRSERRLEDVYLMDVNNALGLSSITDGADGADWQVTHGHMGFYSHIQ